MKLTVVGITVVDVVFPGLARLPSWPRHTEFTTRNLVLTDSDPIVTLGGNGANAAYVAARCGAQVKLCTRIANDALGGVARGWLSAAGCRVETAGHCRATAVNVTASNTRHERATFFYPGKAVPMPRTVGRRTAHGAMLVCGWPHPPVREIARGFRALQRKGGLTALDTGPILHRPWTLSDLATVWPVLGLLLTNEYELCTIARETRWQDAVKKLRKRFSGTVVIKRGAAGVVWLPAGNDKAKRVAGKKVRVVNTVGAGDAFNGALLAALCRGNAFPEALRLANRLAASVVASPKGVLGLRLPAGLGR